MFASWKKSHDQPRQHIKKQTHYFADKGPSSQSYGFSSCRVWMWELGIKKAECQITMLLNCGIGENLRIPWTARWSILKEINPDFLLEGLMLKLKLQYFGHLMGKADSLESWERLKAEGEEDDRGWDVWMASLTQWTLVWANSGSCDGQGSLACCSP